LYKWIYDLDLTSLYPSIIMSLNISPETKIGVIQDWDETCLLKQEPVSVTFTDGTYAQNVKQWLTDNAYTVASNGAVYQTEKRGFLPTILEKWFDERVEYKDKRDEFEVGSESYKFYDALQLTQKVLLNSFYGVLGLKTFRFHDLDNAGAITSTGQSIIKFTAKVINSHYAKEITAAKDEYEIEFEDGSTQTYKGTDLIQTTDGMKPIYKIESHDEIIYPYNISVSV
jgi:DNA polymerase elongation subunit (family B)